MSKNSSAPNSFAVNRSACGWKRGSGEVELDKIHRSCSSQEERVGMRPADHLFSCVHILCHSSLGTFQEVESRGEEPQSTERIGTKEEELSRETTPDFCPISTLRFNIKTEQAI